MICYENLEKEVRGAVRVLFSKKNKLCDIFYGKTVEECQYMQKVAEIDSKFYPLLSAVIMAIFISQALSFIFSYIKDPIYLNNLYFAGFLLILGLSSTKYVYKRFNNYQVVILNAEKKILSEKIKNKKVRSRRTRRTTDRVSELRIRKITPR